MSTFITKLSLFSIFFLFLLVLSAPSASAVCCAGFIAGKTSYINWESCPGRTAKVDDDNCDNSGGKSKSSSVKCEAPACPSGWSETYPSSCEGKNGPAISAMSTKKTCTGTSGKTTLATRACYRCTAVSAACVNNNCGNGSMLNTTSGTSYTCLGYNVNGATISCQKDSPSQTSFTFTSTCNSNCEQTVTTFAAGRSNIKKQVCQNDACSYTPAQEECLDKAMAAGLTREEAWENVCQFLASDTPEPTPAPTPTYTPAQEECLDKAMAAGLTREEAWENVCQFLASDTPEPTPTQTPTPKTTPNKLTISDSGKYCNTDSDCQNIIAGKTYRCVSNHCMRISSAGLINPLSDDSLRTDAQVRGRNNNNPQNGKYSSGHDGLDIYIAPGENVRAAANGVVVEAVNPAKGTAYHQSHNPLVIESQVNGQTIRVAYLHCNELTVSPGETIAAGQTIAISGKKTVNIPHLHVSVFVKNDAGDFVKVDPNDYFERDYQ